MVRLRLGLIRRCLMLFRIVRTGCGNDAIGCAGAEKQPIRYRIPKRVGGVEMRLVGRNSGVRRGSPPRLNRARSLRCSVRVEESMWTVVSFAAKQREEGFPVSSSAIHVMF